MRPHHVSCYRPFSTQKESFVAGRRVWGLVITTMACRRSGLSAAGLPGVVLEQTFGVQHPGVGAGGLFLAGILHSLA